ncbi:MAG: hypothetical protein H5T69_09045 [Chloroflexi bacterium]|nr:hypothetical protein [Chloroflexota bacterium]
MLVLNEALQPIDRVAAFLPYSVERSEMGAVVRLLGKLVAYLPNEKRSYYQWAVVLSYRQGQELSAYQIVPPHLRIILFSRWEIGLILRHWALGIRLGQPLFWCREFGALS